MDKQRIAIFKKPLALLLAFALMLGTLPGMTAYTYAEGSAQPCAHTHDGACGYVEAAPCGHTHDEFCGYDEETGMLCGHEHDRDCGYSEAVPCGYVHDEASGGLSAVGVSGVPVIPAVGALPMLMDAGEFSISGTYSGQYYESNSRTVTITDANLTWQDIDLTRGNAPGTYSISGVIMDSISKLSVYKATVELYGGGVKIDTTTSGPSGAYTLTGLAPGEYTVTVPAGTYSGQYYESNSGTVTITDANLFESISLTRGNAPGTYSISGVISDSALSGSAANIANATVELYDAGGDKIGATTSSSGSGLVAGSYTFLGLAPGTYTIKVPAGTYNGQYYYEAGRTVTITDGNKSGSIMLVRGVPTSITAQPSDITVNEGETATFSVTVTADSGRLAYWWQVDKNDGSGFVNLGTEGREQTYTTPVTTWSMNGWKYRVYVYNNGTFIDISDASVLTVQYTPKTISGVIRSSGAIPIILFDGVTVELYFNGVKIDETTSGTMGAYSFAGAGSGEYTVSVPTMTYNGQNYLETSITVTVTNADMTGQNISPRKTQLDGAVTISGGVVYGQTLTADTSGLITDPVVADKGALSYQWYRNSVVPIFGANSAAYTIAEADIGYTITVRVTAANCDGSVTSAATGAVVKAGQTAPAAPTVAGKTAVSITLKAPAGVIGAVEYRQGLTGAWQSGATFFGLNPNTEYSFYMRLAETATHEASPASPALTVTTDKVALTGKPAISNTSPRFGDTLTAQNGSLAANPAGAMGALSYQWNRNGAVIPGAAQSTYTIVEADIGAQITVTVTAAGCSGSQTSAATSAVVKAAGPAAPTVTGSYTGDGTTFTYTVNTVTGAEYSKDGTNWQDGSEFAGFTTASPATIFYARIKVTITNEAGAVGNTGAVSFIKQDDRAAPSLSYTVSGDRTTITIAAVSGAQYSFDGGATWGTNNSKSGYSGTETVSIQIRLTETDTHNASPANSVSINLNKQNQDVPPEFTMTYAYNSGTNKYTVTIPTVPNGEYSFDGVTYSGTNITTANPGEFVTGYARYKETTTHNASPAAVSSLTLPVPVTSITVTGGVDSITVNGGNGGGGSNTPTTPVTTETPPNMPALAKVSVKDTVRDKVLSATITEKMAKDAIANLKDTGDGIAVQFNVTDSGDYESLSVPIERAALEALKAVGVKYVMIGSTVIDLTLDAKAIAGILAQTTGNVTVTATRQTKLSDAAKAYIGSRPVFDITIKDSKGVAVSDLKGGAATIGIAYKPASTEKTGSLYGVYVDRNGKPQLLTSSSYDNGRLIFKRGSLSVYGVGYKAPAPAFTDTANQWAKDNIDFVVSRGLISGTTSTTFSPNTAITRADFFIALGKLSDADVSGYTASSFTDVANTSPAMPYIEWAVQNKIVQGIGNNQFGPDRLITREQMAVMMVNYAKAIGYTLPVSRQAVTFADDAKISAYAKDAVRAIQQTGVINSKTGNLYDPKGNATRAEASTILRRFVELVIDEGTARGWVQNDAGQWQYVNANGNFDSDGNLATNTTIDGYTVGEDGARK